MNPLEGLAQYLDRLERRLRLFAWTRGAAAVVGAALILTVAIVGVADVVAFSPSGLILGRFVLFLGIGAAIAVGLVVPLMRMNRRRAAQEVEQQPPGLRSAPAHVHRALARQRRRSVPAAAGRRCADHGARCRAGAGDRESAASFVSRRSARPPPACWFS